MQKTSTADYVAAGRDMNAIIALCHFCELHGPSILFCTQALHSNDPPPGGSTDDDDRRSECARCEEPAARRRSSTVTSDRPLSPAEHGSVSSGRQTEFCEACRALTQSGFVSTDQEARVVYVSRQYPDHPHVFSMVRQACVRSLSCEVCPGREGPIFFGNEADGYVLSHTFYLSDSAARGFTRWYSFVVVATDRTYLLNSWPFLVSQLRRIIVELQAKAEQVHSREQAQCPQRAARLTTHLTPAAFRQRRGHDSPARSVVDLIDDLHLFTKLHSIFTWILKAGGSRLTERLLEGPPTEDSVIDLEKQEDTEEGFVKLFHTQLSTECCDDGVATALDAASDESRVPVFDSVRHMFKILGYDTFHSLAHHTVIGNQVIVRGTQRKLVSSVIHTLKILLPLGCCSLVEYSSVYHDSWRCNFLGLRPDTPLPQHTDLYVSLLITEPSKQTDAASPPATDDAFTGYTFTVDSPFVLPNTAPRLLTKMECALKNMKMADSVVDQCIICLKEEWMNKVKVLFTFTKAGGDRTEADTKRLLLVVGAQVEDRGLLHFWTTGLSTHYKNHILASITH